MELTCFEFSEFAVITMATLIAVTFWYIGYMCGKEDDE